jgi:hypothetical protein
MEKGRENFELVVKVVKSVCRGSVTTSQSTVPGHGSSTQTEILVIYISRV